MSSTILNKEIFADEVGLDISEVKFVHKDFHFSSDTNQIYLRNCADMKNFKKKVKLVSPFIEDMLEKHLHHLWEEYLYKNQELKKGVIVSVLPNKKAGFIRCDEYPDNLYFSMNEFKHNITLAKTGQNVTFYEADGFDKKKNKQVKNAVNIYLNGG